MQIMRLSGSVFGANQHNVYLAHQQTVQRGTLETISFEIKGIPPD